MENSYIAFAYWFNNEFMGWRADTFNTISKEYPKIYSFSREQVDVVLDAVKSGCNNAGKSFMSKILNISPIATNMNRECIMMDSAVDIISKTESKFREWKEFELRVHPWMDKEEWYSLGEGDEWKKDEILNNPIEAIEIHTFKIVENEK